MDALKHKTVSGVKWLAANNILQKVISVATFAVLARILSPSIFGLFAMAFIFIDALTMFAILGIDGALIQRKDNLETAKHTAFFMIVGYGVLVAGACFLLAPLAGIFFHNQEVVDVIRILGIVYISGCLMRVPNALLTKEMKFRATAIIQLMGTVANSFFAIIFALVSPTIWALVGAYLIKQVIMTGLSWYFSRYRCQFIFDKKIAKELSHMGKFFLAQTFFRFASQNLDKIVVSKMLGAISMGYYALAYNVSNLAQTHFVSLISRVMFPAYSNIQHDSVLLKKAYLKTIRFVSMVSIPYGILLICLAGDFVRVVYGDKWLAVIPLIQLFGIFQFLLPIFDCSNTVFMGCGKPQLGYRLRLFSFLLKLPLILILLKYYGLPGIIIAALGSDLIFLPLNFIWMRKIINFSGAEFMRQLIPSIFSSMIMLATILVAKIFIGFYPLPWVEFQNIILLISFSGLAFVAYLGAFFIIDRPAILEVKQMFLKLEKT